MSIMSKAVNQDFTNSEHHSDCTSSSWDMYRRIRWFLAFQRCTGNSNRSFRSQRLEWRLRSKRAKEWGQSPVSIPGLETTYSAGRKSLTFDNCIEHEGHGEQERFHDAWIERWIFFAVLLENGYAGRLRGWRTEEGTGYEVLPCESEGSLR